MVYYYILWYDMVVFYLRLTVVTLVGRGEILGAVQISPDHILASDGPPSYICILTSEIPFLNLIALIWSNVQILLSRLG